ncbi:hypothetical protein TNCV_768941 [Trichonephila clavipes]|nr:hypothetical protein TNCV_768941 [Trichonephila clavipes]
MITNFFIPELNNHDVQELWFQDGATYHTARATTDILKDTLVIGLSDKPQTLDHLEDNIRRVTADIRPQMLEKVIENWTSRLDYIRASRGSPMPEIIFKIRVFSESSALKQVVAIHPEHGRRVTRHRQQLGQASGGILPGSHVRWLGESGQWPRLSPDASGRTYNDQGFPWLSKALDFLGGRGSIFVNVCSYHTLCSSEGQGDFRLRRLDSLLVFLIGSLITGGGLR